MPLRKLVNLQNSGDSRHILISDEWSEGYNDPSLKDAVDSIMREWQELTGTNFYDDMFYKADAKIYDALRLTALDISYRLGGLESIGNAYIEAYGEHEELITVVKELKELKEDVLNEFRFKVRTINDIEQKSKQIQEKVAQQIEEETKKQKSAKIYFDDLIVPIEIQFKITIDKDITCAKYASYLRQIKQMEANG